MPALKDNANEHRLIDRFGRHITYVRLSVTDRCGLRCLYCMSEDMQFLPRNQVLTLEQIARLGKCFGELGVIKRRITGGEPLVQRNVLWLFRRLGELAPIRDLTITTNGTQLARFARELKAAGVTRINVSLDSLRPDRVRAITRNGDLGKTLEGIDAALGAGFSRVKINSVILKNRNHDEIIDLVDFAMDRGLDISFIEEMPLGIIGEHDRAEAHYSSDQIRQDLSVRYELRRFAKNLIPACLSFRPSSALRQPLHSSRCACCRALKTNENPAQSGIRFPVNRLIPTTETTGGPSRYYRLAGQENRVGFISPHSHNFCGDCNRVRVTAEGRLLLCLGQEFSTDLRRALRANPLDDEAVERAIVAALSIKPRGHDFELAARPVILGHMNMTGG